MREPWCKTKKGYTILPEIFKKTRCRGIARAVASEARRVPSTACHCRGVCWLLKPCEMLQTPRRFKILAVRHPPIPEKHVDLEMLKGLHLLLQVHRQQRMVITSLHRVLERRH